MAPAIIKKWPAWYNIKIKNKGVGIEQYKLLYKEDRDRIWDSSTRRRSPSIPDELEAKSPVKY